MFLLYAIFLTWLSGMFVTNPDMPFGWAIVAIMVAVGCTMRFKSHIYRRNEKKFSWKVVVIALVALFALNMVMNLGPLPDNEAALALLQERLGYVRFALFAVIMAPLTEEAIFRLFPNTVTPMYALISSLVFALSHGAWTDMTSLLFYTSAGMVLSWAYKEGGFWSSLTTHMIINMIPIVFG